MKLIFVKKYNPELYVYYNNYSCIKMYEGIWTKIRKIWSDVTSLELNAS